MSIRHHLTTGNYKAAHAASIAAIKSNIHDPEPYFVLSIIAAEHGNYGKALDLAETSYKYAPNNPGYRVHLSRIYSEHSRHVQACELIDALKPDTLDDAPLQNTIGVIYSRAGFHERAIIWFEAALSHHDTNSDYHYNLATSAQFSGQFEKAKAHYLIVLKDKSKFHKAYTGLVALNKQTDTQNYIEEMLALYQAHKSDPVKRLHLGHALAKSYEDLGDYAQSLKSLTNGKAGLKQSLKFDRTKWDASFKASTDYAKRIELNPNDGPSPIFIVGLPRTGTTLVDRIISSHSNVTSGGELNVFAAQLKAITKTQGREVLDAPTLRAATEMNLASVGETYLSQTKALYRGLSRLTDKMPLNFLYVPFILKALPNARIIALRRGAMDSCISNFRQIFSTHYSYYNYSFDLDDTAYFYAQFEKLMNTFDVALPNDRFMQVRYENIIHEQEEQTRKLLSFCNLDWEEQTLRFHENKAPVSTASSVQVRQPLYSGSIGRWKKYGEELEGLKAALKRYGVSELS